MTAEEQSQTIRGERAARLNAAWAGLSGCQNPNALSREAHALLNSLKNAPGALGRVTDMAEMAMATYVLPGFAMDYAVDIQARA